MGFFNRAIKVGVWCATSATRIVNPGMFSVVNPNPFSNKLRKIEMKLLPLFLT